MQSIGFGLYSKNRAISRYLEIAFGCNYLAGYPVGVPVNENIAGTAIFINCSVNPILRIT